MQNHASLKLYLQRPVETEGRLQSRSKLRFRTLFNVLAPGGLIEERFKILQHYSCASSDTVQRIALSEM